MNYVWKTYTEESVNNSFSPFDLKESYTSVSTKFKDVNANVKLGIDKKILFLAESLKEEVMQGSEKQQKQKFKQLKKLFVQFAKIVAIVGVSSILQMTIAQPLTVEASNFMTPTVDMTSPEEITPSKIMEWGLKIALIIVAIGAALSMSMFAIVGIYLMITRKREKTIEWNSDITKGLIQVLVSIPLVYALFQLAQIIFRNLPFLSGLM